MAGKWIPLVPVPAGAPARPKAHPVRGLPEAVFDFGRWDGMVGHLFRFTGSDGGDRDVPLSYCMHEDTGAMEWRFVSFPVPRVLYGPWKLNWQINEAQPIILCDDPAAVDAGYALLPFRFAAWIGGLGALKKINWDALDGQTVLLWPTVDTAEDKPNLRAMKQLSTQLVKRGCVVKMVDTADRPEGWNLATVLAEKWDAADLLTWISDHARLVFSKTVFQVDEKGISTPRIARAGPAGSDGNWRTRLQLIMRKGELAECRENVIEFLQHCPVWKGVLAWDEFAYKIVKRRPPPWGGELGEWIEADFVRLGQWLAREHDLLVKSMDVLERAVLFVAEQSAFHPVRDYLKSVSWDGTPRLDTVLDDVFEAGQRDYTALAGRFFFLNLVRRVFEPGCIMRTVLVLVGKQNRGKSTAFHIIGGEWFADTMFTVGDKDSYQNLHGKWLYEIAEFHSFGKAEANRVKAFVSSPHDTFRSSYGRRARDWPRQICFVASTNQYEFLRDFSGNSRFNPVRHGEINLDYLRENRDQLFAEAYQAYLAGEKAYPAPDVYERVFRPEEQMFEITDPWEPQLRQWLYRKGKDKVTIVDVMLDCFGIEISKLNPAQTELMKAVAILQKLGCEKRREGSGARDYYYQVPQALLVQGQLLPERTGTDDSDF